MATDKATGDCASNGWPTEASARDSSKRALRGGDEAVPLKCRTGRGRGGRRQ